MTTENTLIYKELAKSFFLSFKRLSLYAAEHPLSKDIVKNLFRMFEALLKEAEEVLIAMAPRPNEIAINHETLHRDVVGVNEIYDRFKTFKVDGVAVIRGVAYEELVVFLKAMASLATTDIGKDVTVPLFFKQGSEHIKIRKIHYEEVKEGERVASKNVLGASGVAVAPKDICDDLKDFLAGKKEKIGVTPESVFEELDKNIAEVSEAVIESVKQSGDFEATIKKFVAWVSKNVVPLVLEHKREPARFIDKIFDSFKKAESRYYAVPSTGEIIKGCADEIKMTMLGDAFAMGKSSPKKALTTAVKILSDEEEQARLLPRLSAYLVSQGAPQEEIVAFIHKLEVELVRDEEVTISKKKLQKLMRLSERYEEEVEERVKEATLELGRMNEKLSADKERSDEIMRHVAEGVVVVDKSGRVVMMNPAAEKLLDKKSQEALGKHLVENVKEEHLLAIAKGPLNEKDGDKITKEIELDSRDETTKKVLRASSAVVENEDGQTVGMVSVLSDITHEKQVEEMKGQFVSLVTHELRTPVVAIQKSLELILSGVTGVINEDQKKFLDISKLNLTRLNSLINDLLDISRLEAGKFILNPSEFDFRLVISEVKASLLSWINDKAIRFKADVKEDPCMIKADRERLIQVLVNLVGNALKFTPKNGEISVTMNLLARKEGVSEAECLEVCVADSGIGIDPKDFKRIFNKFEQASLVSPVGTGGTGLGLAIVKEIVNLHGGTIWVESEREKGSRFIFVIPRVYKPQEKKEA